jgi:hypothetical protein
MYIEVVDVAEGRVRVVIVIVRGSRKHIHSRERSGGLL